jgi:hypothetical protein
VNPGGRRCRDRRIFRLRQQRADDSGQYIAASAGTESSRSARGHQSLAIRCENYGRRSLEQDGRAKIGREVATDIEPFGKHRFHIRARETRELGDVRRDDCLPTAQMSAKRREVALEEIERIGIDDDRYLGVA